MKKLTYILTISILVFSCNSKEDYIQNVYVDEYVNLNLPEYSELNTSGGAIFTEGGVEGIIIYHGVGDDYKVYDRNCSYEPSLSCSVIDSVNSGIAFCGCCTSAFLISNTGESINAPALLPLKTYNWSLDDNNVMRIHNYYF
jgi:Rieske Fe-S protein